ncbi:hypothetical protein QQS21_006407 [Conoideocrella luteorostrata]|uniref:Amidase domain-containing protein n=1 Tax=Conoideocrella luteorostrata TaxID=1105319 RepID=A0AAJ0CND8_9HYPO|nr:hypothetical protein QQS21_006407 [Conoideocrella luteorostrata]
MAFPSPLFLTAHELSAQLSTKQTTSVKLVGAFLDQIERHNHNGKKLNALIAVAPRDVALRRAAELDEERESDHVRSPLHGIPIIVKDTFVTDPALGMPTSAGAPVFAGLTAKKNAVLIDRLLDSGLIVLGKGNMTEYCGMKSNDTPVGWSAQGGLTLSAYRQDHLDDNDQPTAAGSSNGPTVSVSAGFAPLAVGTETSGSAVYPASVNGVYGLKLSFGSVPLDGVCKLSASFDHIGVFARDPIDLVPLVGILMGDSSKEANLQDEIGKGFDGLSVGVVPNTWGVQESVAKEKWDMPDMVRMYFRLNFRDEFLIEMSQRNAYERSVQKLTTRGARTVYPLEVEKPEYVLKYNGETLKSVAYAEFPKNIEEFFTCFQPVPGLSSLQDVIAWNEQHPDVALPKRKFPSQVAIDSKILTTHTAYTTQTELIAAAESSMTQQAQTEIAAHLHRLATCEGIGKVMDDKGLDIVLSNSDATLVHYASCAGWPVAAVPVGRMAKNGQPYGMFALARGGREHVLLRFMKAWDEDFGRCEAPVMS